MLDVSHYVEKVTCSELAGFGAFLSSKPPGARGWLYLFWSRLILIDLEIDCVLEQMQRSLQLERARHGDMTETLFQKFDSSGGNCNGETGTSQAFRNWTMLALIAGCRYLLQRGKTRQKLC
jgi:hypothetical protein